MAKKNKQQKKEEAFTKSGETVVPHKETQQQQRPFRRDESMGTIKKGDL